MTTQEMTALAPARAAGGNGRAKRSGVMSLADVLGAQDVTFETVRVPEWGGSVRVRSLTGAERDKIVRADKPDGPAFYARVIAASLVDDEGENIGLDAGVPRQLAAKNAGALLRVWRVCQRLSGMGDNAVEEASEELKTVPNDDTPGD